MPFDAQFDKLFRMAAKKPIAEFQQAVHTGETRVTVTDPRSKQQWSLSPELHAKVVGGFCTGASLDWLRKVLQSEKKEVSHLKFTRVNRMAKTQDKVGELMKRETPSVAGKRADAKELATQANKAAEDSTAARDAFQRDVRKWVEDNGGTWNNGNPEIVGTAAVIALFNKKLDDLDALNAALFTRHNELMDRANALRAQANLEVTQSSTAEHRAALWDAIARELETDTGKKRKFSGICPVASGPKTKWVSFKDFLVAALSAPAFTTGRGLLLSLRFEPEPGHAIALHRESSTTTLLFDPNLGVYKFDNVKLLVLAIVVLVELGYIGTDPDGKVTALGDEHGWQVFCKTEGLLPVNGADAAGLESSADLMLAYDAARETVDMSIEMAQELMQDALKEAKKLADAFKGKSSDENKAAWADAHNEATKLVLYTRGDVNKAKTLYPGWTGSLM